MQKLITILCFLFASPALGNEILGKYKSESTIGLGLFGGHILVIENKGFIHKITTDIMCNKSDPNCHLNKVPYKPYKGSYSLQGNQITFDSEFMDEKIYYYVKYHNKEFLLTETDKFAFDQARRLPPVVLVKISDSPERNQP
ncbi:hypothetical protein ACG1BZ_04760 [Microbulbifer sp. CNSA002]|uniref:hypothetical protein n=1 Tax=Microbulbifer sp. CNSA002 TaxID=3373604 RepID=UPI0039B4F41A